MEPIKPLTFEQRTNNAITSIESLSKEQIEACLLAVGLSHCGWTKETMKANLLRNLAQHNSLKSFIEVMG